ncbi:hypothetical protein E2C01_090554 [Portunus trituberculatus]|uniref:Uncharacterized protein n=1 Tax=Portunus trituberculatus TaxID=210409 RepID=A0A5B7JQF1_PORTR|nr:hypothetical protein [Portunus trituberculatus]
MTVRAARWAGRVGSGQGDRVGPEAADVRGAVWVNLSLDYHNGSIIIRPPSRALPKLLLITPSLLRTHQNSPQTDKPLFVFGRWFEAFPVLGVKRATVSTSHLMRETLRDNTAQSANCEECVT